VRRLLLAAAVVLLVAGCDGGDGDTGATGTESLPALSAERSVRVYFLREGKVWPVRRKIPEGSAQANAALEELFAGPTVQEASELGLTTAIPDEDREWFLLGPPGGQRGAASLDPGGSLSEPARAQVVYTLTQFPLIQAVIVGDRTYRRADLEGYTPAILVESPLSFDEVSSPVHAFGTANTFEATFSYELAGPDGEIVDEDFVTATSGTGTRGTFELFADFEIDSEGDGALVVFERSAKDGSRINVAEIPLRMMP
jgi:hypothetical protein